MSNRSAYRTHLIQHLVATAGIILLVLVVARYGTSDTPLMSAAETEVSFAPLLAPATMHETKPAAIVPATPGQPLATNPPGVAALGTTEATANNRDDALKAQFLGIWTHLENGEQWIENRPDGTSRMLLKLNFVASLLYGKRLEMDLTWEVKDGVLTHTIVHGTPMENVNKIIKDYGKSRIYTIIESTPERMLLQSHTDKQKDLWTRTPAPKEWAK